MNFGKVIKEEILSRQTKDRCCKRAFLAGIFRSSGVLFEEDGKIGLDFYLYDEETAILTEKYLYGLYSYTIEEIEVEKDNLNKKKKYILSISGEKAEEILTDLEIIEKAEEEVLINLDLFGKVNAKECCLKSFFKALFLSGGKCSIPNEVGKGGFHLELNFSHIDSAESAVHSLENFGIKSKITKRKDTFLLYIKSAEEIKNFIAFIGAPVSVLKITDLMINREISNESNRRKNCDLGNVTRQIEASEKLLDAIKKLEQSGKIKGLKQELKDTINAKKEFPEDTMIELSLRLNVSKSCLNHRFRRIVELSKEEK